MISKIRQPTNIPGGESHGKNIKVSAEFHCRNDCLLDDYNLMDILEKKNR